MLPPGLPFSLHRLPEPAQVRMAVGQAGRRARRIGRGRGRACRWARAGALGVARAGQDEGAAAARPARIVFEVDVMVAFRLEEADQPARQADAEPGEEKEQGEPAVRAGDRVVAGPRQAPVEPGVERDAGGQQRDLPAEGRAQEIAQRLGGHEQDARWPASPSGRRRTPAGGSAPWRPASRPPPPRSASRGRAAGSPRPAAARPSRCAVSTVAKPLVESRM